MDRVCFFCVYHLSLGLMAFNGAVWLLLLQLDSEGTSACIFGTSLCESSCTAARHRLSESGVFRFEFGTLIAILERVT